MIQPPGDTPSLADWGANTISPASGKTRIHPQVKSLNFKFLIEKCECANIPVSASSIFIIPNEEKGGIQVE